MNVEIVIKENSTWLVTNHEKGELPLVEEFYFNILSRNLEGSKIQLITFDPVKSSIGYDIFPFSNKKINGINLLINSIPECTAEFLKIIIESEEFIRTLLFIVKANHELSDSELSGIVSMYLKKNDKVSVELILCEGDGDVLCLYNSNTGIEELKSIAEMFTTNVSVEKSNN